jgi:hypothetical protein
MKLIITLKTGKGDKSTKKDLDKSVDTILSIGSILEKKFKGFKIGKCRCLKDGTSLILEK